MKYNFWIFQLHENTFIFYKFMNKIFNIFQLQGKYIIKHVKNKFEDKLSKSNFYIKWNSFDIKYEVCLTIVQNHAHKCLDHWNGLLGDVRALIPCVEDQGGLVRGIHVQDGVCCGHHVNIWRMVCCEHKNTYSTMSHTKCFNFDKQFYQTDWSDKQVCWKTKALSKILTKYIQISK